MIIHTLPRFFVPVLCLLAFSTTAIADLADSLDEVAGYRDSAGKAPSIDLYYSIAEREQLSNSERSKIYLAIVAEQKPLLTIGNLISILETKRDSIQSFRCKYSVSSKPGVTFEYAFDGRKIRLSDGDPSLPMSYDGRVRREMIGSRSAIVDARSHMDNFHRTKMPLAKAMLFDEKMVDVDSRSSNIVEFLRGRHYTVFEETPEVDGRKCLLVSNLGYNIYFDIERNFAIKKLESVKAKEADGIKTYSVKGVSLHSGFEDFGNGMFLPFKITTDHGNGNVTEVVAEEMEINPEIEDALFSDIIPDGTLVDDKVRDLLYIQGKDVSINDWGGLRRGQRRS